MAFIDDFLMYFPIYENEIESWKDIERGIIVTMNNGERHIFDVDTTEIRRLPKSMIDISDREFKREFRWRMFKMMRMRQITQRELAERVGITETSLSRYINGHRVPSFYIINRIAKALNCSIDDLTYSE